MSTCSRSAFHCPALGLRSTLLPSELPDADSDTQSTEDTSDSIGLDSLPRPTKLSPLLLLPVVILRPDATTTGDIAGSR